MAMHQFNVGDILGAADVTEYLENTRYATKPSNTSRSSAPGFADDPDLQLPMVAASYRLLLLVQFQSPSAAGFQFTFTGSGSNNLYGHWQNLNAASGAIGMAAYDGGVSADLTSTVVVGGTSGTGTNVVAVDGILHSPSPGTLTFRWAQQNSNAGNTTVYKGSSMNLWRVA